MNVELVDHMGSDLSVVNAARVSFDKASEYEEGGAFTVAGVLVSEQRLSDKDAKLIKYLAKHNHWTPFGHTSVSLRVKAPIFVARQLGKHQVGLVWNEVSRRYVDSEPEFFEPTSWRKRADNVKQGSSDESVGNFRLLYEQTMDDGSRERLTIGPPENIYRVLTDLYNHMINTEEICPEQARMILPQAMYTEWIWTGSVAAFARVCNLRLDSHTQKETRDVAEMISGIIKDLYPVSWEALVSESSSSV
jgi:thymidylate synthase (FAD)